jgi:hypothetical protein
VTLPRLREHDLGVARGVGDGDRHGAGRDPHEPVGVRRPEVHAARVEVRQGRTVKLIKASTMTANLILMKRGS